MTKIKVREFGSACIMLCVVMVASTKALATASPSLPAACPGNAKPVLFTDNFDDGTVKTNWSSNTTNIAVNTSPSGERFLGRSGGNNGLSTDVVSLQLSGLPDDGVVRVSFDLYMIHSIDGNEPFLLEALNLTTSGYVYVFASTFSTLKLGPQGDTTQDYPFPGSPATAGAAKLATLGYAPINWSHYADATYPLRFSFANVGRNLHLRFSMYNLQEIFDESWGIDNVKVSVCPR